MMECDREGLGSKRPLLTMFRVESYVIDGEVLYLTMLSITKFAYPQCQMN